MNTLTITLEWLFSWSLALIARTRSELLTLGTTLRRANTEGRTTYTSSLTRRLVRGSFTMAI